MISKTLLFLLAWMLTALAQPVWAQNIALNKPATSTTSQQAFTAKQVNDGDLKTRWGSEYDTHLTTVPLDSNSVYIDLQGQATITQVNLTWEAALGKDFKIEISNDAQTWKVLVKVTGNTSKTNSLPVAGTGRYVRMHGLKRGSAFGYSLWEFQVLGTMTAPLPVSLVAFSATPQNSAVNLRWTTATEMSNAGFEVQRSADGTNYATLAFVPGAGTSLLPQSYGYLDAQRLHSTSYYRLKQLDLSGQATYSPVQAVQLSSSQTASGYPSPATNQVTVEWEAAGPGAAHWCLTNALGQVVHAGDLTEQTGYNAFTLNLQPYAAGNYVLTISGRAGQVVYRSRLQKVQ